MASAVNCVGAAGGRVGERANHFGVGGVQCGGQLYPLLDRTQAADCPRRPEEGQPPLGTDGGPFDGVGPGCIAGDVTPKVSLRAAGRREKRGAQIVVRPVRLLGGVQQPAAVGRPGRCPVGGLVVGQALRWAWIEWSVGSVGRGREGLAVAAAPRDQHGREHCATRSGPWTYRRAFWHVSPDREFGGNCRGDAVRCRRCTTNLFGSGIRPSHKRTRTAAPPI